MLICSPISHQGGSPPFQVRYKELIVCLDIHAQLATVQVNVQSARARVTIAVHAASEIPGKVFTSVMANAQHVRVQEKAESCNFAFFGGGVGWGF